jgi:hypothetical protein
VEFFFCGLQQQLRLLRVQFEKNYPRCSLDDVIMGHIKLNNNIPISPDKWIYEQDINPIIYERIRYFHMLSIKCGVIVHDRNCFVFYLDPLYYTPHVTRQQFISCKMTPSSIQTYNYIMSSFHLESPCDWSKGWHMASKLELHKSMTRTIIQPLILPLRNF